MYLVPENFIFPMQVDIFYAIEKQNQFGKVEKTWQYDRTVDGYFETYGSSVGKSKGLDPLEVIEFRDKLVGRLKENPLQMEDETYRPITNVLLTNVRDARTQEIYFKENDKKTKQFFATQYEFHFVHPYINPWNEIEYYKVVLNRLDVQELSIPK